MNKKTVILLILCILTYIVLYLLQKKLTHQSIVNSITPLFIVTVCGEDEITLTLTANDENVCQRDNELYIRKNGKKEKITSLLKEDRVLGARLNYLLLQRNLSLILYTLTPQVQELLTIPLPKTVTPVDVFFYHSPESSEIMYITCQREVDSPAETKSVIYIVEIKSDLQTHVTELPLLEMLRVVDVYDSGSLIFLQNMYGFLTTKQRHLSLNQGRKLVNDNCPFGLGHFVKVPSVDTYCRKNEIELLRSPDLVLSFNPGFNTLSWQSLTESAINTQGLTNIALEESSLLSKFNTRIGKRVYNCFDFGESIEITLRVCIPEL